MIFTVLVPEKETLKSFLSASDSSYIDVICDGNIMLLISDNTEIFLYYALKVSSRFNFKDKVTLRVEKRRLIPLVIEGSMEFTVADDVTIKFMDRAGRLAYSLEFSYQEAYTMAYYHKIGLLQECYEYDKLPLVKIADIARVCRVNNTDLSITDGIAFTKFANTYVFQEVDFPNMALSSNAITLLNRYGTDIYNVKNYVVLAGDKVKVIVRKTKLYEQDEYDYLMKQKYTHILKLDLTAPLDLAYRCKLSDGTFILDVTEETAIFKEKKLFYKAPIRVQEIKSKSSNKMEHQDLMDSFSSINLDMDEVAVDVTDMKKLSKHKIPKIEIPDYILKTLLNCARDKTNIAVKLHKTFVRMDMGSLKMVFGRKDVDGDI